MRILEIVLLLIITIVPFIKRPLLKKVRKKSLLSILIIIFSSHLIFEGWRWQMIPIYLLFFVLLWRITLIKETILPKRTLLRGVGYIGLILLVLPSWVLPNVLPVFSLPTPTGNYQVGTHHIHLETNMDEPITKDTNDKRELMIKVWYPSTGHTSEQ